MTQSSSIITQIWREDIIAPVEKKVVLTEQKLTPISLEENDEQKLFREKANRFLEHYPDFVHQSHLSSSDDIHEHKNYTLEVICAIYKAFLEMDSIQDTTLTHFIRAHFEKILNKEYYTKLPTINLYKNHIFTMLNLLWFKSSELVRVSGRCLRCTDTSYMPTISNKKPDWSSGFINIDYAAEPFAKLREYAVRKSKTTENVIGLIWFVETFF